MTEIVGSEREAAAPRAEPSLHLTARRSPVCPGCSRTTLSRRRGAAGRRPVLDQPGQTGTLQPPGDLRISRTRGLRFLVENQGALSTQVGRQKRWLTGAIGRKHYLSDMTKPTLIVDGSDWLTAIDAVEGLLRALRPLGDHGSSIDAFIDSMIYGGMLEAEPPYEVVVENLRAPLAVEFIDELSGALTEARAWRRANYGDEVDVSIRRSAKVA